MRENTNVVFHIGLAKCASTFLQSYFSDHSAIKFEPLRPNWKKFVAMHPFDYDGLAAREFCDSIIESSRGRPVVFSHERLSGHIHSGNYDALEMARRVAGLGYNATIILVIREQYSLIASCYKQYVRIGGLKSFRDYVLPLRDSRFPLFNYKFFHFPKYISFLKDLFPCVEVVLFEDILTDPQRTFDEVFGRCGIPYHTISATLEKNKSDTETEIESARFANFLQPTKTTLNQLHNMPAGLRKLISKEDFLEAAGRNNFLSDHNLSEEAKRLLPGEFALSNVALSKMLNRDLIKCGYTLA